MNEMSREKLRGGYYTPSAVADWLTAWAAPLGTERIMEPSCGDGNFLVSCSRIAPNAEVTAIEFDPAEAAAASRRFSGKNVINSDFFSWFRSSSPKAIGYYDAVVGNPPFIRYQNFPDSHREAAFSVMRDEGMKPSRLTNAWLPFVVCATRALREGGRLAMVLPAELLQVSYAGQLRAYLTKKYASIHLVSFDKLIFPGILQEVVLVLAIRKDCDAAEITTSEFSDAGQLGDSATDGGTGTIALASSEKWTKYYLSSSQIELLRTCQEIPGVKPMRSLASVDVGIVTGRNQFFVLTKSAAAQLGIQSCTQPMVGRSAQIPGLRIDPSDWRSLHDQDSKVLLYNPGKIARSELDEHSLRYVEMGEGEGHHEGYKCRIRQPTWWSVPSVWNPDAFLLRQIYDGPRVVLNDAGVTCTDTIHRVKMTSDFSAADLASVFSNSLTWAFAEVRGRSYGGGVLELEPTEAESLPVPTAAANAPELDKLDWLQRTSGSTAVLEAVDESVLKALGLDVHDRRRLRSIWQQLSARRSRRKAVKV